MKALLMAVLVTAVFSGFGSASPEAAAIDLAIPAPEESLPAEVQEAMDRQVPALDAYEALQSCLTANTRSAEVLQPWHAEEYGGEYIDGDRLVIQLVDRTPAMESRYRSLCGDSPNVVFEDVRYTLDELEEMHGLARELAKDYSLVSYGVDLSENKCVIRIVPEEYDDFMQDERVIQNQGKLLVEQSAGAIACASVLYGGDRINLGSTTGDNYSLCIGGTYNGSPAILTAGHYISRGQKFYRSGKEVGTVAYVRANTIDGALSTESFGDFSIVTLNTSNFTRNNRVRNAGSTVPITGTALSCPEGTMVYKYGSTTGYSWGEIISRNETVNYKEKDKPTMKYEINGLSSSRMQNSTLTEAVAAGDSGGSVYIRKSSSVYQLQGSVSGQALDKNEKPTNIMYSSPIGYAVSAGFTPCTS